MQQLLFFKQLLIVLVGLVLLLRTDPAGAYDCNLEPTDPVNFNNINWCPKEHCTQVIDPVTGKTYEVKACDDLNKHKAGYCVVSYVADQGLCKCACSCLAYGTPILLANGSTAAVNHIRVGDSVLVANGKKWEALKVISSSGTSPRGKEDAALFVSFEAPAAAAAADHKPSSSSSSSTTAQLVSNPSQIYLVADGATGNQLLVRADQLDPTKHSLLDKEFKKVRIHSIHVGTWNGGLWHVSTEHPKDAAHGKDMDKAKNHHLLLANGVVVGDWYLQSMFAAQLKNSVHIPVLSESERVAASTAASGHNLRRPVLAGFVGHSASLLNAVPEKAGSLLPRWAQTGKHLAGRLDTLDTVWRREHMQSMMAVYSGIYPEITFETEWLDDVANIYSWTVNGKGFISIHGGILRHKLLHWEGLAFVIARQIAQLTLFDHTYDESDPFSLSCENWADYNAGLILQNVFGGGPVAFFINMIEPGVKQLEAFFKSFPKIGTLQPTGCGHPRNAIDVECRVNTFKAVFYASPMPSCWDTTTTTTTPAPPSHHNHNHNHNHQDEKDEL